MSKFPPNTLIRTTRSLWLLFLAAALTAVAFSSPSAAKLAGRWLGDHAQPTQPAPNVTALAPPVNHRAAPGARPVAAPAESNASAAFVTTDQTDYKPGETVVISGSGWLPGETINLSLHEESATQPDTELTAMADEYGNILSTDFVTTAAHLGAAFTLTASGQSSARTATAKFTDGGIMNYSPNSVALTAFSGTAGSSSTSFTQTVTAPSGNGNFQAPAQVTSVSVSGSLPMPASWVTVTGGTGNFVTGPPQNPKSPPDFKTRNVSVTPAANTAPGIYSAIVTAVPSIGGVGVGQGTVIQLTVTADNAPPTTTLSAADANSNPYNGSNFISTSKVTLTLSATDNGGAGVANTRYKIDNGPFKNYTGPFDIAGEGLSVVTYFSTDNIGAQETAHIFTVKLDRTAPSVNCGSADAQWHAIDVNIHCTAVDGGGQQKSGLANAGDASFALSTNVPAGTEDNNAQTNSRNVCDNAGNCAPDGPIGGNMIDKATPATNCSAADGVWHGSDVAIPCTASDGGSGLANAADASFNLATNVAPDTEDSNAATGTRQVCDAVNNCATAGPVSGNMIDKKAPSVSCGSDDGSWHPDNVSILCSATDGGSGVVAPASASLTTGVPDGTETANASTDSHQFCDGVGNCSTAGPLTPIKVDRKAPGVSCGSADSNWHADNVSIPCTSSDGGSGLAHAVDAAFSLSTNVPVGTEDANASTDVRNVCDAVGHCSAAGPISGNMIDKAAPTITASAAKADSSAYTAGDWVNQDVIVSYQCTDGGSGVASVDGPTTVSSEGADQSATGNCTDNVGHTAAATFSGIYIDKAKPTLSFDSYLPAPNGAGWNNTNVSVAFTPADALSGVASTSTNSPLVLSTEGTAVTGSVTVTDVAGNSETFTTNAVKIDKTAPTLNPARHAGSAANGAGWNNSAVTVDANAADALSGLDSVAPAASQTVSTEGANQSVSFTATDVAGNSANALLGGINIDLTPPSISASRTPSANGAGWNNTDVTASYNASDALSGLTEPATGAHVFSAEGTGQSHTFTVHDVAGNMNSATVSGVNIDKTAPTVTITAPVNGSYLLNQTVAANYSCSDTGAAPSGIDTCTGPVASGSNIDTATVGSHTFTVNATDKAGNTASAARNYSVFYDWSNFLPPINLDGTSIFKLGSTVPVKFRLTGGSAGVMGATNFRLYVAKLSNSVVGTEIEAVTSTPASTSNLFRYDATSGQYIYNMGTKDPAWSAGTWQLRVDLGDGALNRTVLISLKP
ncbi:MAG: OmpL47-type beta-barrel domain-containing protein [Pyrinomonadaceae bacterium]